MTAEWIGIISPFGCKTNGDAEDDDNRAPPPPPQGLFPVLIGGINNNNNNNNNPPPVPLAPSPAAGIWGSPKYDHFFRSFLPICPCTEMSYSRKGVVKNVTEQPFRTHPPGPVPPFGKIRPGFIPPVMHVRILTLLNLY